MKLSVCMMVKNEEGNLARCLESLRPLVKAVACELIIVDTGSTDNTVEIARQYTDKVYFHPWKNDFSAMRNISIAYATGDWILIIDADEEIEDVSEIVHFLNSPLSAENNTARVMINNVIVENRDSSRAFGTSMRLFRNDGTFKYTGVVHNQPCYQKPVCELGTVFLHYGYICTDKALMDKKFIRTSTLLKEELAKNPQNFYYRYQLAVSYKMHGDIKEALSEIIKAYDLIKDDDSKKRSHSYVYPELVMFCLDNGRYDLVEQYGNEGIQVNKELFDVYFYLAKTQALLKRYDKAVKNYQAYLDLVNNFDKLAIKSDPSFKFATKNKYEDVYLDLALIFLEENKYQSALKCIQHCNIRENTDRYLGLLIRTRFASKQFSKLKQYYVQEILTENDESIHDNFISQLEQQKQKLSEEDSARLVREFAIPASLYGLYNRIRLAFQDNSDELDELIDAFLAAEPDFRLWHYGDVVYYLLLAKKSLHPVFNRMQEATITTTLAYIESNYQNVFSLLEDYLAVQAQDGSWAAIRCRKMLTRYLLLNKGVNGEKYNQVFKDYVHNAIKYIKMLYSEQVLKNELAMELRNDEDAFVLYIALANENAQDDHTYLAYLKKALYIYPPLAEGIKVLINERENELGEQDKQKKEFEQYKVELKKIIRLLIDSRQYAQAGSVIEQYRSIVAEDAEIDALAEILLNIAE